MEAKHDMLYPPLGGSATAMPTDPYRPGSSTDRRSGWLALPAEAPPTYDAAMSQTSDGRRSSQASWMETAISPQPQFDHSRSTMSVIVEQPQATQSYGPAVTIGPAQPKLGPNPCAVACPACNTCDTTRMCYTPNSRTHLVALLLCLVGWCCCACCVPYCMNSCRTGNHYCSKCNTFLGAYNPRPTHGLL